MKLSMTLRLAGVLILLFLFSCQRERVFAEEGEASIQAGDKCAQYNQEGAVTGVYPSLLVKWPVGHPRKVKNDDDEVGAWKVCFANGLPEGFRDNEGGEVTGHVSFRYEPQPIYSPSLPSVVVTRWSFQPDPKR